MQTNHRNLGVFLAAATILTLVVLSLPVVGAADEQGSTPRTRDRQAPRENPGRNRDNPVLQGPLVKVTAPGDVAVGETIDIEVRIDTALDVSHVPFHVAFNPDALEFVSGQEGDFLDQDGEDTVFVAQATTAGDSVVVGLSRLGRIRGVRGSGVLCRLQFRGVGPGASALTFQRASVRNDSNRIIEETRFLGARVRVR